MGTGDRKISGGNGSAGNRAADDVLDSADRVDPRRTGHGGDPVRISGGAAARIGVSGDFDILFGAVAQSDGEFSAVGFRVRDLSVRGGAVAAGDGGGVAAGVADRVDCVRCVSAEFPGVAEGVDRQCGGGVCAVADGVVSVADMFCPGVCVFGICHADGAGGVLGSRAEKGVEESGGEKCLCAGADPLLERDRRNVEDPGGCEFRPGVFDLAGGGTDRGGSGNAGDLAAVCVVFESGDAGISAEVCGARPVAAGGVRRGFEREALAGDDRSGAGFDRRGGRDDGFHSAASDRGGRPALPGTFRNTGGFRCRHSVPAAGTGDTAGV